MIGDLRAIRVLVQAEPDRCHTVLAVRQSEPRISPCFLVCSAQLQRCPTCGPVYVIFLLFLSARLRGPTAVWRRCTCWRSPRGCGRGELLGLRWQDVDLEGGTLSVRQ